MSERRRLSNILPIPHSENAKSWNSFTSYFIWLIPIHKLTMLLASTCSGWRLSLKTGPTALSLSPPCSEKHYIHPFHWSIHLFYKHLGSKCEWSNILSRSSLMHDKELKMDGTSQVIQCSVFPKSKATFLKGGCDPGSYVLGLALLWYSIG